MEQLQAPRSVDFSWAAGLVTILAVVTKQLKKLMRALIAAHNLRGSSLSW